MRASDPKAFETLFRIHYQPLCLFANRFLNDLELSKETVSDVFSYLWEHRTTIVISVSLKAYLHKIVQNKCLNIIKRKKIENRYVDYMLRTGLVNDNTYFDKITDAYYSKQLGEEINGAINKLPERCREIFRLSRFEEMSYKEIAERLSISPKTVENQMGIALAKLKAALNKFLTFFF
ncbi:RNA polymerase sigma-70 factor [Niabella soli]|nr:RNA polymerase sigma-70 factor [Niabella soli]